MNNRKKHILNSRTLLEELTKTLLYEGYALFPYHRTAVKNQKPMPFGVVYPKSYNDYDEHAHAQMRSECIVAGRMVGPIKVEVRFLHFRKIELFENKEETEIPSKKNRSIPILNLNGRTHQTGWQTLERKIGVGDLSIEALKCGKQISIDMGGKREIKNLHDANGQVVALKISSVEGIRGVVKIRAVPLKIEENAYKITVTVSNMTQLENAEELTRDEVQPYAFLSTHIILETDKGAFISQQNPGDKWWSTIASCKNENTWPILVDRRNTLLLSSPIIVYDHPEINPMSPGDMFDSTEIEEALMLHFAVMSDDEKKRIGQSDVKLQAMLDKVNQVTPEEMIDLHGGLKDSMNNPKN